MAETLSPRSLPSVSEANLSLRFSSLTVNLLTPCEGLERQPPGGQPPESAASVADLLRYHLAAAVTATGVAAGVNRDHAGEIARASLELTSAQISSLESVVETEAGNAAGADQAAEAHEAGLKEAPGQLRRAKLCPRVLPVTVKGTRGVVAVPADDEALASFLAPWLRLRPAGTSDRRGDGRAGGGRVAASFLWESPDRRCPPSASRAECRATVGDVTACVRPGSTGPLRQFLACVSAATSRASWPDTEAAESTPPAASLGALSASASLDALRLVLCAHSAPRPAALALCIDGVSLDGARDAPDAAHSSPPLRLEAGLGALSASLVGSARLWGGTCGFSSESDMDAAPVLRGAASSISFSSGARGASWSAEFGPIDVSVGAERWATAAAVAAGAMATIGPPECKKVLEIGGRRTGEGRDGGEGGEEEDVHGCAPTGTLRVRVHGASMSGSKAPQGSAHVQCHVSSFVGAVSVRSLSAVGPTSAASCYFRASGIALASGGETAGVAADVKRARVWLSGSAADVEELVDALGEETGGPGERGGVFSALAGASWPLLLRPLLRCRPSFAFYLPLIM